MRGVVIIAALLVLVAGCGDKKQSDLENALEKDAKAVGLDVKDVSCKGSAPKFDCKILIGQEMREAEYEAVQCGPTYDARAKPPPAPIAPVFHLGGDCEADKYVPQRQAALAVVRTKDKAGCKKYWGKGFAADCDAYLRLGSPNSDARVAYVEPRNDGTVEVALVDPGQGPRGLAVRVKAAGKPVVAGLVNFPP
jgi:hypothetical protein